LKMILCKIFAPLRVGGGAHRRVPIVVYVWLAALVSLLYF
jgi:hypothetical protein